MTDKYNSLRPEAGPVPFNKLQRRAKDAINQIIPALLESVTNVQATALEVTGEEHVRSKIDTNRSSRLFFISGEPGAGKSTVYLTLRAMTSSEERFATYGYGYKDQKAIDNLKKVIQWLEPLDLEVAGDERDNLLAAVLVRLFDAIERSGGMLSERCEAAIKELEGLATDIGIAWEGNLQARAGAIDPATYSEEVMLAQRARLGVNNRLNHALNKLAAYDCCGCGDATLFVLPVEDLYLKPDASLQLLRLLRMISVPRLFFLLMGDVKTVEALFTEKALADWTSVAGPETFMKEKGRMNEALARARELRARYLRKLLPPGQRTEIEAMDWYEALQFTPEQFPKAKKLLDLLKEAPLNQASTSLPAENLFSFLVSPPPDENKTGKEIVSKDLESPEGEDQNSRQRQVKNAEAAYTALQILDATPREIMDLWFALSVPRDQKAPDRVRRLVENFARYVVDEQSFLDEDEQTELLKIFTTRHYFDRELDFSSLKLAPEPSRWIPLSQNKGSIRRLWFRMQRSWELKVNLGEHSGPHKLPPRPAAWVALMHDLSLNLNDTVPNGSPILELCRQLNNDQLDRSTDLNLTARNFGWFVLDNGKTCRHFPMPELRSYMKIDRFLHVWNSGVEWIRNHSVRSEEKQVQRFVNLWLLAGRSVDSVSYAEFATRGADWFGKQMQGSVRHRDRDDNYEKWSTTVMKISAITRRKSVP